ncbi:MAG: transcription antitermination factor NusB [Chitinivibrionales bacterium]|nr:transcription antitermination factor NusB [Chitinivibrionales bacterium]
MKQRREARELALKVLYACEMCRDNDPEQLIAYLGEQHSYAPAIVSYGRDLVRRTLEHIEEVDQLLGTHAANWRLDRMAAIDRNILRMAVTELLFFRDVPYKVVIDEAVEIAKAYGTDESGKFVNGVIDAVYRARLAPK